MPIAETCGTWIEAVRATDATTGRLVWSAHLPREEVSSGHHSSAHVTVGQLPDDAWVEDQVLALEPRPSVWSFEIDASGKIERLQLNDADLQSGFIARQGHPTQSAAAFNDDTCGYGGGPLYITATTARVGLAAIVVAGGSVWLIVRRRKSRALK